MSNMRVLIVTGSYPPMKCGIGDYSRNLTEALSLDSGINVGVLTSISGNTIENTERFEISPIMTRWSFFEVLKVIKFINRWKPNIVHIQHPTQGYRNGLLPWLFPIISFLMAKKVVQTWHEGYGRRDALKLLLKSIVPSTLVFVRPNYKDILHPMLRWSLWGKKTVFIQNASSIPRVCLSQQEKDTLKSRYLKNQKRLIVFLGFVYPHKGVELLFEIASPDSDHIVIVGEIDDKGACRQEITKRASSNPWAGKITITGFLPANDAAALLAVADAVVLPFKGGAGEWNTSIHAAVLNGALVITTSLSPTGYDKRRNVYFAEIDDIRGMRLALATYAGTRREYDSDIDVNEWQEIADQHCTLYKIILSE